jgi:hypothetical protein
VHSWSEFKNRRKIMGEDQEERLGRKFQFNGEFSSEALAIPYDEISSYDYTNHIKNEKRDLLSVMPFL